MEKVANENNLNELRQWAKEAIDLLDEVKPYRSFFYKQKVAKLKNELSTITRKVSDLKCRVRVQS